MLFNFDCKCKARLRYFLYPKKTESKKSHIDFRFNLPYYEYIINLSLLVHY